MKLQYLMIIFIIIAIPMILLLTYYMTLQKETIALQASYDAKLISSTKQALEAFEVNTVEWDNGFSGYADSKRRDILASINTFKNSFANSLNLSGLTKESLLQYIPAVMYNLYDGYYIYTPTSVPLTRNNNKGVQLFQDGNSQKATVEAVDINGNMNKILYVAESGGTTYTYEYLDDENNMVQESIEGLTTNINNAKKEYKHTLKTFIEYTEKINNNTVVSYALDNFIKVYTENEARQGYLINTEKLKKTSGGAPIKTVEIKYDDIEIHPEVLSEYIKYIDTDGSIKDGTYTYVYNTNNEKCYREDSSDRTFFKIKNNKKVPLPKCNIGDYNCEYKLLCLAKSETEIVKLYQPINPLYGETAYLYNEEMINRGTRLTTTDALEIMREYELFNTNHLYYDFTNHLYYDFSAVNYYTESYVFTNWVNSLNLGNNLKINNNNNPEDENSLFNTHKKEVMKTSIIDNLNLAISSYSAHSSYNYSLPIFTYEDWNQILSNVSMTTFVQGMPIGLKYYNNYIIAISSSNKEYLNPDEIYYISEDDNCYHLKLCDKLQGNTDTIVGYRNTDFVVQSFETHDSTDYYFKHATSETANEKCYYCLVLRKLSSSPADIYQGAYLHAIARERYVQKK